MIMRETTMLFTSQINPRFGFRVTIDFLRFLSHHCNRSPDKRHYATNAHNLWCVVRCPSDSDRRRHESFQTALGTI